MIVEVDRSNLDQAAAVHAASWKASHRPFCSPEFVELHTPERQKAYLQSRMAGGGRLYMLVEDAPVGVVSVTGSLIGDLYVLPERQNMGFGTKLLQFAVRQCPQTPTLWILEDNDRAKRFYRRAGFRETGRVHTVRGGLAEIELSL